MKLIPFVALIGISTISMSAFGQAINPVLTWDVSADNGATWTQNLSLTNGSPASVKVRGSLSWGNASALGTAYAVTSFDGLITGALAETGSNIVLPMVHVQSGGDPGAVVNLGNGTVRFSTTTDTGAAGSNTTWWILSQDADFVNSGSHTFPDINRDNPAYFLYFDLAIDYSANHLMDISCILNPVIGRAARVYNEGTDGSYTGQTRFNRNQVSVEAASIQVTVPAPTTIALLSLSGFAATRRRR